MKICKILGAMMALSLICSCGNRAVYLRSGTVIVLEKPVTVTAAVPGEDGKLIPHTVIELPAGTEVKYGK